MSIGQQITGLERMTIGQLRARYSGVFGEPSRSNNRRWLVRRIAWRIQMLAEGDLAERAVERARARAEELARDQDLRVRPPTDGASSPGAGARTVSRRVAWRDDRVPIPGTVLTRVYKGVEHRVTVLGEGFEHEGTIYRSLSAAAYAISGSHWNGFLFFGLTRPGAKGDSA
jgi:hypothetical protein